LISGSFAGGCSGATGSAALGFSASLVIWFSP